jgi:hypothetical protein
MLRHSPGLEDLWQVHYQADGGKDNNAEETYIANLSAENCKGYPIKLSAQADAQFTMTNTRSGFTKKYAPRK